VGGLTADDVAPWVVGKLSRADCERHMLKNGRDADFVIRSSPHLVRTTTAYRLLRTWAVLGQDIWAWSLPFHPFPFLSFPSSSLPFLSPFPLSSPSPSSLSLPLEVDPARGSGERCKLP